MSAPEEVEKTKRHLVFSACQYACAMDIYDRKPELGQSKLFTMLIGEASQELTRAARAYFKAVTT